MTKESCVIGDETVSFAIKAGVFRKHLPPAQKGTEGNRCVPVDTPTESIKLLGNSGYMKSDQKITENGYEMGFVRGIKNDYPYPRFHIVLVIPSKSSHFEIAGFHIDRRPHKALTDFSKKNNEVWRLIEELEKEEECATRNELLSLFKYELLTGDIRELTKLKGKTQEKRWSRLLRVKKQERLRGKSKYRWCKRKDALFKEDRIN